MFWAGRVWVWDFLLRILKRDVSGTDFFVQTILNAILAGGIPWLLP
jgi:hypothetical protein